MGGGFNGIQANSSIMQPQSHALRFCFRQRGSAYFPTPTPSSTLPHNQCGLCDTGLRGSSFKVGTPSCTSSALMPSPCLCINMVFWQVK